MEDKQLSKHFRLYELVKPEHRHLLTPEIIANLTKLCQEVEWAREIIGKPFKVLSGWRPKGYNARVGGAPKSYHIKGMAIDFVVDGMAASAVRQKLSLWKGGMELNTTWIHLDIGPKRRFNP